MFQKLKDGANKLKAKIGGDDLDEKLVQVVSEQNWQASTQQLHEIANAAYNYEKWQRINEFIWDKLKKSKSWKKILKTFNLIEFLLKNGPPSIISNFKYDLYQLRTFESYSNYVDGLDKGEPIRERAKVVVNLLNNEELLEEERVKAKTIREKMSNVVGGTTYGGGYGGSYNSSNSGSGNGGSYGSSSYSKPEGGKKKDDSYNYGSGVGYFGDYTYNKSTLDKYKDTKNDKPGPSSSSNTEAKKEEKKSQPVVEVQAKKPFEKIASKLSKPGEKKELIAEEPAKVSVPAQSATQGQDIIGFDIFGGEAPKTAPSSATTPAPFSFDSAPSVAPVQVAQPQVQQPFAPIQPPQTLYPPQPQPVQQPFNAYGQPQQPYSQPQQPYGQPQQPYVQPQQPYVQPQQPLAQPAQTKFNQYGANPAQFAGYNPYGQPQQNFYGQPNPKFGQAPPQNYPQQQVYSPYVNPMYPTTAPLAVNQAQQPQANVNLNLGITLNPKKQQQFGSFSANNAGTAQNVSWLSNTEKGLIDFSDFGSEIKKEGKPASKQLTNNIQIDTTWSW